MIIKHILNNGFDLKPIISPIHVHTKIVTNLLCDRKRLIIEIPYKILENCNNIEAVASPNPKTRLLKPLLLKLKTKKYNPLLLNPNLDYCSRVAYKAKSRLLKPLLLLNLKLDY